MINDVDDQADIVNKKNEQLKLVTMMNDEKPNSER